MQHNLLPTLAVSLIMACATGAYAAGGGGQGASAGASDHGPKETNASSRGADAKSDKSDKSAKADAHAPAPKTVQQRLAADKPLSDKLAKLLPPGTDLQTAAAGFKNLGQFVAAVHVSANLGIPFADLKSQMLEGKGASLGQAIKTLRPDANADAEIKKAQQQSKR